MPSTPPALRLLILVITTMLAAGSVAPRLGRTALLLFPLSAMLLAAVALWTVRRGSWGLARTLGGVGTGMMIGFTAWASQIPPPHRYPPWVPARIEGLITNVRERPLRLQIHGEVDRQDLPAMQDTDVLVRVSQADSVRHSLRVGTRVVVDAMTRLPTPFHLPTEMNEAQVLASLGVTWSARARASDVHPLVGASAWHIALSEMRRATNNAIHAVIDSSVAPIAMSLITGDRSEIPSEQRAAYAAAGTAHMLSVSGSHVALILSIIVLALSRLQRPYVRLAIAAVLICLYVVFTGAEPPAVRSAIMGIVAMSGRIVQRRIDGLNVWALTMLVMICVNPTSISSVSFQLSAWATLGLIVLTPRLLDMCSKCTIRRVNWKRAIAAAVSVTLAANAAIALPAALTFETVSLISPIANLVVVPLMSVGMIFTLIALICLPLAPAIALLYGQCAEWCLTGADVVTRQASMFQPNVEPLAALILATVIALGTWWVGSSSSWRHVVTRTTVITVVAAAIMIAPRAGTERTIATFEREDCTVVVYPLPAHRTLVRIVGRTHEAAIHDIALQRYVATLSHPIVQRSHTYVSTRDHARLPASTTP